VYEETQDIRGKEVWLEVAVDQAVISKDVLTCNVFRRTFNRASTLISSTDSSKASFI
jgi:hypothetical protein